MKLKHKPLLDIFLKLLLVLQLWLAPMALTYAQAPATTPVKEGSSPSTTPTKPPVTTPKEGTSPTTTPTTKPARAIGPVEKTIGQYLCTPTVDTNLYSCINKLYRFSLAAGFFIAVLFIVVAGYLYMTGGEKGITTAKSIVSSTFIAIIIMSTSYILLRQINPELVKFKPIQPLNIQDQDKINLEDLDLDVATLNEGVDPKSGGIAPGWGGSHSDTTCNTGNLGKSACPNMLDEGISCTPINSGGKKSCHAQVLLVTKLKALKAYTDKNGPGWTVTDGFPPAGTHKNDCHNKTGSCVDIDVSPDTSEGYANMCKALSAVGGFEYKNEGHDNSVCKGIKTELSNGTHIHVGIP